jgi:glutamate formiminotransferase/formiminotetrahydrofolate cyclodeaminase
LKRLVECVPNFSEGRDRSTIEAIAEGIRQTPGCTLLDVDPGQSTNRTVYTFVGSPEAVVEAALNSARVAKERIDMRRHQGAHPRMGAMDVCPFVPVSGVDLADCVACAKAFGQRAAEDLGIPVYLYEAAATEAHRKSLKQIRAGEYEGLPEKIAQPEWRPDFGPAAFLPTWGATAAGARFFLIAYNVNILGTKEQAHRIALSVREQGRGPDVPGKLRAVKGIGWYVKEYGMAQVSMNLDDYTVTPPHVAFEACLEEARRLKVAVAGSELVGLIPLQALLVAADHYIAREDLFILDESQKIRLAVERLGLSSVSPFRAEKRIIEYMIAEKGEEPLAGGSVRSFVELLGSRAPAPGGGSAAALSAAMGAALGAMVGWTTYGKRKFEDEDALMRRIIPPLHQAMTDLIPMIDADTAAFNEYMAAAGMPKDTAEQAARRHQCLQEGLKKTVEVPLRTMRLADGCWDAMVEMAAHGNLASRSDLEVGAKSLEAGIWGAARNVSTNLPGLEDEPFRRTTAVEVEAIVERAKTRRDEVLAILARR